VPGERTRKVMLDPGASTGTPVRRRGPGRSLPGPGAGHPLQRAGPACYRTACAELTATVTATAATNGKQQRPVTAQDTRTIRSNWGYVRPEKAEGRRSTAAEPHTARCDHPGPGFARVARDRHVRLGLWTLDHAQCVPKSANNATSDQCMAWLRCPMVRRALPPGGRNAYRRETLTCRSPAVQLRYALTWPKSGRRVIPRVRNACGDGAATSARGAGLRAM
jgi:hypothetical protein